METRASYTIVGAFVLALVAATIVIVVWIARVQFEESPNHYLIRFTGDVTGLSIGSPVRYRGVPVGRVSDISISPKDVERVRVDVELERNTPVKTDTIAQISAQGLTGVAFIQLTGGTQSAPPLTAHGEGQLPEIKSQPSTLQEVLNRLPMIFERVLTLSDRLTRLLDDKNLEAVTEMLQNLQHASEVLGAKNGDLSKMLRQGREALVNLNALATESRSITQTLNQHIGPITDNAQQALAELRKTIASINKVTGAIDQVVQDNRGALRDFSQNGLPELSQFASEARVLVDSLIRLSQQIERDPARFFFGDIQKGYRPP
jgi:phospholipid/cholesterol/gamma-HCH transport system substrate-binding protein